MKIIYNSNGVYFNSRYPNKQPYLLYDKNHISI